MSKAIKKPFKSRQTLIVISDTWAKKRCYIDRQGKRQPITFYSQAREYAENNHYTGIEIRYKPLKPERQKP